MSDNGRDEDAWFAPKRFGYGAGMPIAWQGWAVLGVYLAFVAGLTVLVPSHRHPWLFGALVIVGTGVLIVVAAQHTRGGWRWRWGEEG